MTLSDSLLEDLRRARDKVIEDEGTPLKDKEVQIRRLNEFYLSLASEIRKIGTSEGRQSIQSLDIVEGYNRLKAKQIVLPSPFKDAFETKIAKLKESLPPRKVVTISLPHDYLESFGSTRLFVVNNLADDRNVHVAREEAVQPSLDVSPLKLDSRFYSRVSSSLLTDLHRDLERISRRQVRIEKQLKLLEEMIGSAMQSGIGRASSSSRKATSSIVAGRLKTISTRIPSSTATSPASSKGTP